jgi:hypothetical protein
MAAIRPTGGPSKSTPCRLSTSFCRVLEWILGKRSGIQLLILAAACVYIAALFFYLVHDEKPHIDPSITEVFSPAVFGGHSLAVASSAVQRSFRWTCSNSCSCLPPVLDNVVYMHQSYKSEDALSWPTGWKYFRQTWLDLHPNWYFVFWLDEHNELLAKCMGYGEMFSGRSFIQQADLARLMYLDRYGGMYSDMDYMALANHEPLLLASTSLVCDQSILLQGRQEQVVGLEWGFARHPGHPIWNYCLTHNVNSRLKKECAIYVTGPKMLTRCLKAYYKQKNLTHMLSYNGLMILEPRLLAPIAADDLHSDCGKWRSTDWNTPDKWDHHWTNSTCRSLVMAQGGYALTVYSHSWGEGLKC